MLVRINSVSLVSNYDEIHQAIEQGMQPVPTHLWGLAKDYVISRPETFLNNGKVVLDSIVHEGQNLVDLFYFYRGESIIHALQYVMDFICLLFI